MNAAQQREERWRTAMASVSEVSSAGRECPAWERIWGSARNELEREANEEVILHLGECTACATAWRATRDLTRSESEAQTRAPGLPLTRKGWALGLAATFFVVAIGLGIVSRLSTPVETPPSFRTQESGWIRPEQDEGTPFSRDHCLLRWTAGPEGTTYDVHVTTENLEPLARAWRLESPEFLVDPEVLQDLPPGAPILWRVIAYPPGRSPESSRTFRHIVE